MTNIRYGKEKECPFNVRHWVTKTGACLGGNHVCRLWIQFGPHCYTRNFFFLKHQPLWQLYPASLKFEWSCVQPNSFYSSISIKTTPPLPSKWPSVQRTNATSSTPALLHPVHPGQGCQSCLSLPGAEEGDAQEWDAEDVLSCNEMQFDAVICTVMQWDALWYNMRCTELQWDADAGDAKIVHPDFGLCIPALHTAAHPPRPTSVFIIPLHAFFGSTNTVHYRLSP